MFIEMSQMLGFRKGVIPMTTNVRLKRVKNVGSLMNVCNSTIHRNTFEDSVEGFENN